MALFTTITEIKNYVAIDANAKMVTLLPYINEAELLFLTDLLGETFYNEFTVAYAASVATSPTPLSSDNAALLPYIQRCLAYYTMMQAIPFLTVNVGDQGARTNRGEDSDPAPRWLIEKLQFAALKNADIHADKLLLFLEKKATSSVYASWFTSTANTRNSGYIVNNTTVASNHIDINGSRRVFLKLRNKIRDIETNMVPKLIGQAQYDALLVEIKAGTLTATNNALLAKIEPIICKRALYMQLPFMRIQVNENGIFVYSGTDELFKPGQFASDPDIKILRCQLMDEKELGYLADENRLRQFILDNIEDYPLIKASTVYTIQPIPGPTWTPKNDTNDKHFKV